MSTVNAKIQTIFTVLSFLLLTVHVYQLFVSILDDTRSLLYLPGEETSRQYVVRSFTISVNKGTGTVNTPLGSPLFEVSHNSTRCVRYNQIDKLS